MKTEVNDSATLKRPILFAVHVFTRAVALLCCDRKKSVGTSQLMRFRVVWWFVKEDRNSIPAKKKMENGVNFEFIEGFRVNTKVLHCLSSGKLFVADRTSPSGQRYFKCRHFASEQCQSRGVISNNEVTFLMF
jgi:hypothetical protein